MVAPAFSPDSIIMSLSTGSSARSFTTSDSSARSPYCARVKATSSYAILCAVGVTPSASGVVLTANGTELNLGSNNLVVDGTAGNDFAFNSGTNTITIKSTVLAAGSKFKTFRTTGSVTFINGASAGTAYTSAAGTVVTATVTYSAVNTTTGVVTCTNIGANKISGCLVCPTDGSETFKTFIPDGFGLNVFNSSGSAADQPFPQFPTAGTIITANVLNYPSDTSLVAWFKLQFAANAEGKFIFDSISNKCRKWILTNNSDDAS